MNLIVPQRRGAIIAKQKTPVFCIFRHDTLVSRFKKSYPIAAGVNAENIGLCWCTGKKLKPLSLQRKIRSILLSLITMT